MNSTSSVPLTDALPWPSPPPSDGRFFLVCDSIETDGRFLLLTLASQVLSSGKRVLWVACGPWTDQLIAMALKKMGCETAASYLRDDYYSYSNHKPTTTCPLHVRSVPVDMSTQMDHNNMADFNVERYIKELYHSITSLSSNGDWIVVDDVSALATLVGTRLAYCFVLSLQAFVKRTKSCSIMVRCSHDLDMEILRNEQDSTRVRAGGSSHHVDWVGAGGRRSISDTTAGAGHHHHHDIHDDHGVDFPWERALPELADGIVNVEPLASGYSREAHGRLVFVEQGRRGWGQRQQQQQQQQQPNGKMLPIVQGHSNELIPFVMNFSLHDTSVSAIRLRR